MKNDLISIARETVRLAPQVRPHLSAKTRWTLYEPAEYKTTDYMLNVIEGLVNGVYNNLVGGDFIDAMANLISGQLTQAFQQAFEDEGYTDFVLPDYLNAALESMILSQYDYVDGFFRDIINARIDGTSISPLLARARLWANQWQAAYNEAIRLMTLEGGGNLMWVYGEAEHCETCNSLNGIVASAKEWDELGVQPQNAPNNMIACGGWNCQCSLTPTDKRRSPKAYDTIMNAVTK